MGFSVLQLLHLSPSVFVLETRSGGTCDSSSITALLLPSAGTGKRFGSFADWGGIALVSVNCRASLGLQVGAQISGQAMLK